MSDNPTTLAEFFKLISEEKNKTSQASSLNEDSNNVPDSQSVDPMDRYVRAISSSQNKTVKEQQDYLNTIDKNFVTFEDLRDHYKTYIERLQVQLASLGGGGEVKFLRLDDVDASTVGPNKHLAYDPSTGKVFFEEVSAGSELTDDDTTTQISNNVVSVINLPANTEIGPISEFLFDTTHNHTSNTTGIVCWNTDDDTLNINHSGGVTQQVGQELYGYVRNNTGNTITNGTCVRFDGAEAPDGEARLEVAPFLANGTFPDIYALGIATQDIDDGEDGRVTTWGKVRNIDASGNTVSETWNVGDILYANPDEAGLLTNVKPTAPDNVVPIAAVLSNDSVTGELFVRPTVEQKMSYGVFTRTTDLSPTNDTPAVVGFDTDEISNGVTLESNTQVTVSQSGLYQIEWTLHWDSQGTGFGTDPVYTFLRKNGTDIPNTLRRNSVSDFDDAGQTFTNTRTLSLDADDYIEVVVVTTGGNVDLVAQSAITSPFNAPATAAAEITVAQIQL